MLASAVYTILERNVLWMSTSPHRENQAKYFDSMAQGHQLMKAGKTHLAASIFECAVDAAGSDEKKSAALHMWGVCERVNGRFQVKAGELLRRAEKLTDNPVTKYRILRDRSMVTLLQGDPKLAYSQAMESYDGILESGRMYYGDVAKFRWYLDEAYASLGFAGEASILMGPAFRRRGIDHLVKAYHGLMDDAPENLQNREHYLLNTSVRLLKYAPTYRTSSAALAGVKLALKDGNLRRVSEIVIITVAGRHAYNLIEMLYRVRQRH